MIVVHHLNNSRSQRILWMLEEMGTDYEIKRYERNAKTQLAPPELAAVHPLGKSPVISDGDRIIAESGAIIEYLASLDDGKPFRFDPGSDEALQASYWVHFAEGSLMPPLLLRLVFEIVKSSPMPFFVKPIARAIAGQVTKNFIGPNIQRTMAFINDQLDGKQWLVGDTLSLADFQMSFPLEASVARGVINDEYPNIGRYVRAYQSRPAYQRALDRGGDYDYLCS